MTNLLIMFQDYGWQILISQWIDTPKRLLGQKTYF
jgi:hypothetical protein